MGGETGVCVDCFSSLATRGCAYFVPSQGVDALVSEPVDFCHIVVQYDGYDFVFCGFLCDVAHYSLDTSARFHHV